MSGQDEFYPSISEWIQSLNGPSRSGNLGDVVNTYYSGKTLAATGEVFHVTRERIRQRIRRALRLKKKSRMYCVCREDIEYAPFFEKYNMDFSTMHALFDIPLFTYRYLDTAYKRGTGTLQELLEDQTAQPEVRERCKAIVYHDCVNAGGVFVHKDRKSIIEFLIQSTRAYLCVGDLRRRYERFLAKYGLDTDSALAAVSDISFMNFVSRLPNTIMTRGQMFRRYHVDEHDLLTLIDDLDLQQFKDVEISTKKLFDMHRQQMRAYDILDEYELHNLLRRTASVWNSNGEYGIVFGRMPMLTFGNADREEQAVRLLAEIGPVRMAEYARAYEARYGVEMRTVLANIVDYIVPYGYNGVYCVNNPAAD